MLTRILFCCALILLSDIAKANGSQKFSELIADIKDKRIVFLDELTHGEKEVFALKTELVKYLHQHAGFEALVLESGMYDMQQLWHSNNSIRSQASGNIFYMYANEPEVQSLFSYLDKMKTSPTPLILAGFDGRLSGQISLSRFVPELQSKLKLWLPKYYANMDWSRYSALLNKTLNRALSENQRDAMPYFNQQSLDLINTLRTVPTEQSGYQSPEYYALLLEGLWTVANNLWDKKRFDEHDVAMANNLDWLLHTELKEKKVIVWGQFVHLNKHSYTVAYADNVTSIIRKRYQNETHVVHFSALKGQYKNFVTGKVDDIVVPINSAEQHFWSMSEGQSENYRYMDKASVSAIKPNGLTFFGLNYQGSINAAHSILYWDSVFLLNQVSPSN